MPCYEFQGLRPVVDAASYLHPLASLIGDVIVGPGCYIGPGASLRADFGRIIVERDASIQDNATIHVSTERDTVIKRGATIAHGAVVHGCEIGENCLVGINSVVLDAAILAPECLVAAMSFVPHGMEVPQRSVLMGIPARIVRTLAGEEVSWRNDGDGDYQLLTREALTSLRQTEPLRQVQPVRKRTRIEASAVTLTRRSSD
ncbi:gamma carbonic anhydrase family protein [Croceicoccus sp. Ery5]|uniref:gamma carbonic anhydrase family protein n=1 Tax=Croceicoccus sp. Ery5 TaxID=1703340 RepID=UPI001E3AB1D4|nr:phenylacetic acid degradation protein PaaY [Croceicoccus sp. Ery5]